MSFHIITATSVISNNLIGYHRRGELVFRRTAATIYSSPSGARRALERIKAKWPPMTYIFRIEPYKARGEGDEFSYAGWPVEGKGKAKAPTVPGGQWSAWISAGGQHDAVICYASTKEMVLDLRNHILSKINT